MPTSQPRPLLSPCLRRTFLSVAVVMGLLVLLMLFSTYASSDRRRTRAIQLSACGLVDSAQRNLAQANAPENAASPNARLMMASRAHALLKEATRTLGENQMPQTLCSSSGHESATALLDQSRAIMAESSEML